MEKHGRYEPARSRAMSRWASAGRRSKSMRTTPNEGYVSEASRRFVTVTDSGREFDVVAYADVAQVSNKGTASSATEVIIGAAVARGRCRVADVSGLCDGGARQRPLLT